MHRPGLLVGNDYNYNYTNIFKAKKTGKIQLFSS